MIKKISTYDIRRTRTVRVRRRIRVTPRATISVRRTRHFGRFASVPLVYHQVDGHFAFQTTDISMAEIITQLMDLQHKEQSQLDSWTRHTFTYRKKAGQE